MAETIINQQNVGTEPADNPDAGNNGANAEPAQSAQAADTGAAPSEKVFTQEDVNKLVTERLNRQKSQLEKRFADEKAEAEKVAKMNAEEKAAHEREKHEKALAEREAELTRREMTALAKEKLSEKGVSASLLGAVDLTSADTISASVEEISKAYTASVAAEVKKKLAGEPPKSGGTPANKDPFLAGLGV